MSLRSPLLAFIFPIYLFFFFDSQLSTHAATSPSTSTTSAEDIANIILKDVCYETKNPGFCVKFAKYGIPSSRIRTVEMKRALIVATDIASFSTNRIYRMLKSNRIKPEYTPALQKCLRSYYQATRLFKSSYPNMRRDPVIGDYSLSAAVLSIRECDEAFASKVGPVFLPILATNQVLKRFVSFGRMFIRDVYL